MSLADVPGYFKDKMESLNYQEWTDEFNTDNIPRSLLDKVYHMELGLISGSEAAHTCFTFDFPITLTLFSCTTRPMGSSAAAQDLLESVEALMCSILAIEDRYSQSGFLKIVPSAVEFQALNVSNDNVVRVEIEFGVQVKQEYRLT